MKNNIKLIGILTVISLVASYLTMFSAFAETTTQTDYYVQTEFNTDGDFGSWNPRDADAYPKANLTFNEGEGYVTGTVNASTGWFLEQTMPDGKVFEGTVNFEIRLRMHESIKQSRNLFTICRGKQQDQVTLLTSSYGYFYPQTGTGKAKLYALTPNTWHTVKIKLDFSNGAVQYFVDGDGPLTDGALDSGSIQTALTSAFKPATQYNTIKMYMAGGAAAVTDIDYIRIYSEKEVEVTPEPTPEGTPTPAPVLPEAERYYYLDSAFAGETEEERLDGWGIRNSGNFIKENVSFDEDGMLLKSSKDKGWLIERQLSEPLSGKVYFETRVKRDHYNGATTPVGGQPMMQLFNLANSASGNAAVSMLSTTYSRFQIGGPVNTTDKIGLAAYNDRGADWEDVLVEMDIRTGKIKYFINGVQIIEYEGAAVPDTIGGFSPALDYNWVRFYESKFTGVTTKIDYIKIYKEDPYKTAFYSDAEHTQPLLYLTEGDVYSTVDFINEEAEAVAPVVVTALYKGNQLVSISADMDEIPVAHGEKRQYNNKVSLALEEGEGIAEYRVRIFIWNGLENMRPLTGRTLALVPDCDTEL